MSVDNEHINKKNFLIKEKDQSHVAFPSSYTELPEIGMNTRKQIFREDTDSVCLSGTHNRMLFTRDSLDRGSYHFIRCPNSKGKPGTTCAVGESPTVTVKVSV